MLVVSGLSGCVALLLHASVGLMLTNVQLLTVAAGAEPVLKTAVAVVE